MKNIEKYTNTKDALEAYNSLNIKNLPFDEWLEYEYKEPHQLTTIEEQDSTLLEAAEGVMNEWYVMTPHGSLTGFVAELSRLSSAIEREKRKPVRNCDKYRTAEEANVAFAEFCGKNECRSCRCGDRKKNAGCVFEWLYEKAEREVSK